MKHLRLFENKDINTMLKSVNTYNEVKKYLTPIIIGIYEEMYSVDNDMWKLPENKKWLQIIEILDDGGLLMIRLIDESATSNKAELYTLDLTYMELQDGIVKYESNKYNI